MHAHRIILLVAVTLSLGYAWLRGAFIPRTGEPVEVVQLSAGDGLARATFAAGCFWCVEADFDHLAGVIRTVSGYTGGHLPHPTYEQVSRGGTGHTEAVVVLFDPEVVTYEALLEHYWRNVDPFVAHRQFCDVGTQYRPEIFVHDEAQRTAAEESRSRLQDRFTAPIVVRITEAGPFYPAEAYHQDYAINHPVQYRYYRWRCRRDARLRAIQDTSHQRRPASAD